MSHACTSKKTKHNFNVMTHEVLDSLQEAISDGNASSFTMFFQFFLYLLLLLYLEDYLSNIKAALF